MWANRTVFALLLSTLTWIPGGGHAQEVHGAFHYDRESLDVFAVTETHSIFVFAFSERSSIGSSGFAVLNLFDFTTSQFHQCLTGDFDLMVGSSRSVLSFVTEESSGFNCPAGEEIFVSCELNADSGVFHNVTNGTAKIGAFDQQYTTHGRQNIYNNVSCVLSLFGEDLFAQGNAFGEQQRTTP